MFQNKRKGKGMTKITFSPYENKTSCNVYFIPTSGKYLAILLSGEGK